VPDILLVGCGKMGGALAQRWRERRICAKLVIVEPSPPQATSFKDIPPDFVPQAIVFAVKPQILGGIIGDYRAFVEKGALVLSIAAGKPAVFFETHFGTDAKIIRCMPNLPASIGKGITVAYANRNAGDAAKELASSLLGAVGEVLWVDKENLLDPVTALSGSGPAYVFLLAETLAKAGVHIGLDPQTAEKLARQTVIGSAALLDASPGISAAQLRENVTSPGGTTQAALGVLMAQPGIQELFDRALLSATRRAGELSG